MDQVESEFQALRKAQTEGWQRTFRNLDDLIGIMEGAVRGGADASETGGVDPMEVEMSRPQTLSRVHTVSELKKLAKKNRDEIVNAQKDVHNALTKLSKTIDRVVPPLTGVPFCDAALVLDAAKIELGLAHHFFRSGQFDVGEVFVKESKIDTSKVDTHGGPFREMHSVLEELKIHNVSRALEWAKSHSRELEEKGSQLEFRLHCLEFIRLLTSGDRRKAITYAQKTFRHFVSGEMQTIQRLMGSLLFEGRLMESPYAEEFFTEDIWKLTGEMFGAECCAILGLPSESPLHSLVSAGTTALPIFLKAARIFPNADLEARSLPVEVDLGPRAQFHSIFVCPVSREESTEANPPMILPCGHVLCKSSISKLPKGNARFKCPYCPSEQTIIQCVKINF